MVTPESEAALASLTVPSMVAVEAEASEGRIATMAARIGTRFGIDAPPVRHPGGADN